jgi:hypothetical protein
MTTDDCSGQGNGCKLRRNFAAEIH